eukprot:6210636-Pleurochrysis_carterae.AAC.4
MFQPHSSCREVAHIRQQSGRCRGLCFRFVCLVMLISSVARRSAACVRIVSRSTSVEWMHASTSSVEEPRATSFPLSRPFQSDRCT